MHIALPPEVATPTVGLELPVLGAEAATMFVVAVLAFRRIRV
jgi:hypothetical protein